MNEITKPISVVRQEFIERLVHEVNSCELPLFVVEPILENILSAVKTAVQKQYETEKAQYEKMLAEKAKADEK